MPSVNDKADFTMRYSQRKRAGYWTDVLWRVRVTEAQCPIAVHWSNPLRNPAGKVRRHAEVDSGPKRLY